MGRIVLVGGHPLLEFSHGARWFANTWLGITGQSEMVFSVLRRIREEL